MCISLIKNKGLYCLFIIVLLLTSCKTAEKSTLSLTTTPASTTQPSVVVYSTLLQALTAKLQDTYITIEQKRNYINLVMASHYVFTNKKAINNNFKTTLNIIITALQHYQYKKIIIAGYTDNEGKLSSNETLSRTWATNIEKYFVSQGLSRNTLSVEANGEYAPIASNYTFAGRLLNRRVELHIYTSQK